MNLCFVVTACIYAGVWWFIINGLRRGYFKDLSGKILSRKGEPRQYWTYVAVMGAGLIYLSAQLIVDLLKIVA